MQKPAIGVQKTGNKADPETFAGSKTSLEWM